MALLEHFRPPLSVTHPWKGFHSAWANAITSELNEVLPEALVTSYTAACRALRIALT
jgi:hypothetical protein